MASLNRIAIFASALALSLTTVTPGVAAAAAPGAAASASSAHVVPLPVSMTTGHRVFTLTPSTRIVANSAAAHAVAEDLAAYLRPATGYPLHVVDGNPGHGDFDLRLGNPGTLSHDPDGEGYQLDTSTTGVTLEAMTAHGLFNGVQTIRQLLPAWIESSTVRPGPWTIPVSHITDYPRYTYRGVMLDIARHYESPATVKKFIGQIAAYKINIFHLHLSDDQGFRIAINSFPRLTSIGSQGSVGTDGRTMDPGGFWTQADYKSVVAYAAAHFITLIPEVDSPGHNNAIIMSEYNDTANPLLNGHPQDINCGTNNPPVWNFTGDVGYSAMCPSSDNTWTILTTIIKQLSALSPGPYYDMGGDEVTQLTQTQYNGFLEKEAGIVQAQGKIAMGWADISAANLSGPTVAEYWAPSGGNSPDASTFRDAAAKGMPIVMAPANHAYLDQVYSENKTARVPPNPFGQDWACATGCDVDQFYNWDPSTFVSGAPKKPNVIGVESAVWTETLRNLSEIDYMAFPRMPATAELGWSPAASRTSKSSPAYRDFVQRLASQATRWYLDGVNFYPSPEVPWHLAAATMRASVSGSRLSGVVSLAAPGVSPADVKASVSWGDGHTTRADVDGTPGSTMKVNSLYAVTGSHTYKQAGTFNGVVMMHAAGEGSASVHFCVHVNAKHQLAVATGGC